MLYQLYHTKEKFKNYQFIKNKFSEFYISITKLQKKNQYLMV